MSLEHESGEYLVAAVKEILAGLEILPVVDEFKTVVLGKNKIKAHSKEITEAQSGRTKVVIAAVWIDVLTEIVRDGSD